MKLAHVRCQDGFSLIETLIAFTVLSLVIMSSLELFGDGTKRVVRAQQQAIDLVKLQNAITLLRLETDLAGVRETIDFDIKEIETSTFKDSELRPFLLRVSMKGGDGILTLQTIILKAR